METKESGIFSTIEEQEARRKPPLVLAFIGDTVYDLYMRGMLVRTTNTAIHPMHKKACSLVNAHEQSLAVAKIEDMLTETESDIFRRGRNAKCGTVPKNMSITDYHRATGLESVIGYLFLTGNYDRINELFEVILNG